MKTTWDTLVKNLVQKKKITPSTTSISEIEYLEADELVLGNDYTKNDIIRYSHTSGLTNPITVTYLLEAKEALNNYDTFDIHDWNIIQNRNWSISSAVALSEKYDIFPKDLLVITGELNIIPNNYTGIITSDILVNEFTNTNSLGTKNRLLGSGLSSIQLVAGQNIVNISYPVFFDESSFGIVDNHLINGARGHYVLFDNIPDNFELYIKVTVDGNPTKRTLYPELPSSFNSRFYFTETHWSIIETSDFVTVNSGSRYVSVPLTFTNDGDYYYYKFWKTSLLPKVRFTKYSINTTPAGL